jgi:predicted glycogen debranching enzyme
MDAKLGDWVVHAAHRQAVEVQALWMNALASGAPSASVAATRRRARALVRGALLGRGARLLHDVVDVDHRPGTIDAAFRPNQIFAVGGCRSRSSRRRARAHRRRRRGAAVDAARARARSRRRAGYTAALRGRVRERDAAYHQGTSWPWLLGAFVEAWVRVRGGTDGRKSAARRASSSRSLRTCARPGSATCPRSPTGPAAHAAGLPVPGVVRSPRPLRLDRSVLA